MPSLAIKTTDQICPQRWDQYVLSHPKGSVFHTRAMLDAITATPKHRAIALAAVDDDGQVVALLTAARIETVSGFASRMASRCIWYAEPLCDDSEAGFEGLAMIVGGHDQLLRGNTLFTEVRPLSADAGERKVMESRGYEWNDYLNFLVNTTDDADVLMGRVSKSARKKISQSFRRGVEVSIVNTGEGIDRMYALVAESYQRSQIPLADVALFHSALEHLGDEVVQVRLATHQGEDVAGGISLIHGDRFFAWYGGSSRPHGIVPFDCLTWDEIRWCSENEVTYYDFGGAGWPDEEYGPRDFKAKFGGELTHFGRYRKVFGPLRMKIAETGFRTLRRFVSPRVST